MFKWTVRGSFLCFCGGNGQRCFHADLRPWRNMLWRPIPKLTPHGVTKIVAFLKDALGETLLFDPKLLLTALRLMVMVMGAVSCQMGMILLYGWN